MTEEHAGRRRRAADEERDATTERLAEVSHTHEDQPEYQGEMWKRGRRVRTDDE